MARTRSLTPAPRPPWTCAARLVAYFVRFPRSYPHGRLEPLPRGRLRLDWFGGGRCAAAFQPAGWFLLVVPASLLASLDGLGTFVGCSTYGLSQTHVRIDRLGDTVRVQNLWQSLPTVFTLPHPPPRQFRSQTGSAVVQPDKPKTGRTI